MRVFVAMSGGVDSSVAAALLAEAGHDVVGVTMQLLPEGEAPGQCCGDDAVRSARGVCDRLGIAHYVLNTREVFAREVVEPFVSEYAQGRTPNPCIDCNDRVKFAHLLAFVCAQGADALATGHYARVVRDESSTAWLARGADANKDQSYFLYRLVPPALDHVLLPVGAMHKVEVRAKAASLGLAPAGRSDSQEICFVADGKAGTFVGARTPVALTSGPIVDAAGGVLGTHQGIARYTVGQRKGLGIASTSPLYVTALDAARNEVVVGRREDLERTEIQAERVVWRAEPGPVDVILQTRYRMRPVRGRASRVGDALSIALEDPLAGVAPGQAVVCYQGDRVVGGGVVTGSK